MPTDDQLIESRAVAVSKIENVDAPSTPEVYANHIQVGANTIDFSLHFGSIVSVIPPDRMQVARRVSVVISPEVAKMLHLQLTHGIVNFERHVRKIPDQMQVIPNPAAGGAKAPPEPRG